MIFSNPNNPSGSQLSRAEVIRLIESVDCLVVVVDEAYMDFSDQSVLDLAGKYENLIVLRTLSKAMGLAGARMGFAVSDPALTFALRSVRTPITSAPPIRRSRRCCSTIRNIGRAPLPRFPG